MRLYACCTCNIMQQMASPIFYPTQCQPEYMFMCPSAYSVVTIMIKVITSSRFSINRMPDSTSKHPVIFQDSCGYSSYNIITAIICGQSCSSSVSFLASSGASSLTSIAFLNRSSILRTFGEILYMALMENGNINVLGLLHNRF